MSGLRIGGIAAALFVVIGSFLPWATVDTWIGTFSATGTDGDGVITLLLGLAAGALIALWKRPLVIIAAVAAGLAALVALVDLVDLGRAIGDSGFADVTPGIGLILTLLAAMAAAALAVVGQAQLAKAGHPTGLSLAELNRGAALPTTSLPPQGAPTPWQAAPAQPPVAPVAPAAPPAPTVPAGWHPDPSGAPQLRYWDGTRWTEHVHATAPAAPRAEPGPGRTPRPSGSRRARGPGYPAAGRADDAASAARPARLTDT